MGHCGSHDSKIGALHLGHDIGYDAEQDNPQTYQSGQVGLTDQVSLDSSGRTGQKGRDART
jgi:hypothetical protein